MSKARKRKKQNRVFLTTRVTPASRKIAERFAKKRGISLGRGLDSILSGIKTKK